MFLHYKTKLQEEGRSPRGSLKEIKERLESKCEKKTEENVREESSEVENVGVFILIFR